MAALVLSFSAISGERETATLRLMIANSVPRHRVLLSKLVGISTALLMPLLLSVLVALLVLDASPVIAIASPQIWPALLLILGVTGLFLLGMVGLGLLVSTLTHTAMNAMVLAFLIWAGLVLGIPKVSPMFADILHPVQRASTFDFTKRLIAEDIDRELIEEREALRKKCFDEFGAPESDMRTNAPDSDEGKKAKAEFERLFAPIAEQYKKRLAEELRRVERDYRRRTSVRSAIAMNLSRISPVCSYTYVVCGLAGTGAAEPDNFIRNAQRFQDDVKQNIYTKVIISRRRHGASFRAVEGFDARTAHLPDMTYAYPPLTTALQNVWPDILLLGLFDVLFFSLAFLRFNKYDMR
jgi:ABC-type transport system involved in multi-copper enzyme maturation permease subunit